MYSGGHIMANCEIRGDFSSRLDEDTEWNNLISSGEMNEVMQIFERKYNRPMMFVQGRHTAFIDNFKETEYRRKYDITLIPESRLVPNSPAWDSQLLAMEAGMAMDLAIAQSIRQTLYEEKMDFELIDGTEVELGVIKEHDLFTEAFTEYKDELLAGSIGLAIFAEQQRLQDLQNYANRLFGKVYEFSSQKCSDADRVVEIIQDTQKRFELNHAIRLTKIHSPWDNVLTRNAEYVPTKKALYF
jgi:hypothetical protein